MDRRFQVQDYIFRKPSTYTYKTENLFAKHRSKSLKYSVNTKKKLLLLGRKSYLLLDLNKTSHICFTYDRTITKSNKFLQKILRFSS